jgi:hypothetical protein
MTGTRRVTFRRVFMGHKSMLESSVLVNIGQLAEALSHTDVVRVAGGAKK